MSYTPTLIISYEQLSFIEDKLESMKFSTDEDDAYIGKELFDICQYNLKDTLDFSGRHWVLLNTETGYSNLLIRNYLTEQGIEFKTWN